MSRRSTDEIVSELVGTGLDQRQLGLVIELLVSQSRDMSRDILEMRRASDRLRKRKQRVKSTTTPKANDVGSIVEMSRDRHVTTKNHCNLLRKGTSEEVIGIQEEVRRKDTEGVNGRAERVSRGTRLTSEVPLSDIDRKFAVDNGVSDPDRLWAEFIDYWIGIPGQRGTKLNWSATWRNRVRMVAAKVSKHEKLTPSQRAYRFAERIREVELAASTRRQSEFFGGDSPGGGFDLPISKLEG